MFYLTILCYYIYILTNKIEGILTNPFFRIIIIFYCGLINGYNTNNFMNMSS